MIKRLMLTIAILFGACAVFANAGHVIDDSKNPRYLFILTADTGSFKDGKLTLNGIPIVAFYALGVKREAGHFFVEDFIKIWNTKAVLLKADPPNGTLNVVEDGKSFSCVIELSDPGAGVNAITFRARVLEGELPDSFGPSSLFLDMNVKSSLGTEN
ncbi:MAG: hypothetical protein RIG61_00160 [Deltaproteobacteria bacterium]